MTFDPGLLTALALGFGCTSGVPSAPGASTDPAPDQPPTGTAPDDDGGAPERLCHLDARCFGAILDAPKAPCTLSVAGGDGVVAYDGPAGFELRGRSSLAFPKHQYAVELRAHTELPLWPGAAWRYLDDGDNARVAWREPGFDDAGWTSGPAPLGHGEDWLQTVVATPGGSSGRSVTTYFRATFTVAALDAVTEVGLGLKVADGAAVYLNGVEVARVDLAPGAAFDTAAGADDDAFGWVETDVDPALLLAGDNVVAVEVHRSAVDDPGLVFDLYVEATGDSVPVDLLGMGAEDDWIVNGQYVDRSLLRNRLMYDVFQSFGGTERYATETRFCDLTLDGEYLGVYTLGEKLDRGDERLDLARGDEPGDTFLVELGDDGGFRDNAVGYGAWEMVYPDEDEASAAAVSSWLEGWEDAVLGPTPEDPDRGIFAWLDLGSAVDWVIVNELAKNHDAYVLSVYLWKNDGAEDALMFAPWDFDLSMGYPYTDCGAEGWIGRHYTDPDTLAIEPIPFIQELADVPAFRTALSARWAELRAGPLAEDALLARIAGYDATLAPAIDANVERWPIEDIAFSTVSPEVVDNWLCPVTDYAEEHQRTLDFLTARLKWIDANIDTF